VGMSESTGKADSLMALFFGKERVITRSADWQKKLVEKASYQTLTTGGTARVEQDRSLHAFKKQTVSSRNILRALIVPMTRMGIEKS
jgi:hypothetical protein